MTRPPHTRSAPEAQRIAEALRCVELALCLLAGIEHAQQTEPGTQQALSRIRVLTVQAGASVAYCHDAAQLRAVLHTRRSQLEAEARSPARCAAYETVSPLEHWQIRSDKAR